MTEFVVNDQFSPSVQSQETLTLSQRKYAISAKEWVSLSLLRAVVLTIVTPCLGFAGATLTLIPRLREWGHELIATSVVTAWLVESAVSYLLHNSNTPHYHRSLLRDEAIPSSQFHYHLNLGILKRAIESTDDPQLQQKLRFLAANYLAKAAPFALHLMKTIFPNLEEWFQVGALPSSLYHRMSWSHSFEMSSTLNKNLALSNESPLVLTNSDDFAELLPLSFTPIPPEQESDKMVKALTDHFAEHPSDGLSQPMSQGFLFDLTDSLKEQMVTHGNKEKERACKELLAKQKERILKTIDSAVEEILKKNSQLNRKKLKRFIEQQCTCICRLPIGEIGGVKILPLFSSKLDEHNLVEIHPAFVDFIDQTGLYIDRINTYRHVLSGFSSDVRYQIGGVLGSFFDLRETDLFKRLSNRFKSCKEQPLVAILGQSTLKLLDGLMKEIEPGTWHQLQENPTTHEVVLASLVKIQEQLATAELWMHDDARFAQAIELVHCEMTTLLELASPFADSDFAKIYPKALPLLPEEVRPYLQAGLGKTAMSVYTGIRAAISRDHPHPTKVYATGLYYEEAASLGKSHLLSTALNDPTIETVDLYMAQFSPNIEIAADYTHYQAQDVQKDLRALLQAKPNIQQLTVAVDCTIDLVNSPKVANLLREFQKEIEDGKLNFVFFRSGQKLTMLGMDNYFGAPFYVINNGDAKWKSFKSLTSSPLFQADHLSHQWFCLSHLYAREEMDQYANQIFANSRAILDQIPDSLHPSTAAAEQSIRVNIADQAMDATFIDIKVNGKLHQLRSAILVLFLYYHFLKQGIKIHSRPSFGFYHPNCIIIQANAIDESSTIRFNPGLNPAEITPFVGYLQSIAQWISA